VAVEPFPENYKRLHKSIWLQNFQDKIVLVINPVSDKRSQVNINLRNFDNKGAVDLVFSGQTAKCINCSIGSEKTILITDLLEVITFKTAIIKIDIEGHEPEAFKYLPKLLDNVFIPIIFMEWEVIKRCFISPSHKSIQKDLTVQLISTLIDKGFTPFDNDRKLHADRWETWPWDITWRHQRDI